MSYRATDDLGTPAQVLEGASRGALEVWALGPTRIRCRGAQVEKWVSRRGLDILRYLVLNRRPIRRDILMDLLWPRATAQSARNNLNVAISGLRRSLEAAAPGTYVIHRDGNYSLDPDLAVWVDIAEFDGARRAGNLACDSENPVAARAHYERAASLYRGPLFEDSDAEWFLPDRRLLEERYIAMQERFATLCLSWGEEERAIDICHAILRAEPCRESVHQLLMRSYGAQSQYHLAARQYAECVSALEREFGLAPHPRTTEIFRDLLAAHLPSH